LAEGRAGPAAAGGFVRSLAGLGRADRQTAGGKGASLGELTGAGFPVPAGFVVTTAAFEYAIAPGAAGRDLERLRGDDHAGIVRAAAAIRQRIEQTPLPAEVRAAIAEHYHALPDPVPLAGGPGAPVAVRSSATGEDGGDASFAGTADTFLWVRGPDAVADHVRSCWGSLYSVESVSYRRRRGIPEEVLGMGVVVQRMVEPRCSGVMFTRSPTTGDRSVVAVEASWGLGSAIVSGHVTPDTYVVSKVTGEIVKRTVAGKLRRHRMATGGVGVVEEEVPPELRDVACLSDDEIRALVRIARRVEDHYGAPQDIEWAIGSDADSGAAGVTAPSGAAGEPGKYSTAGMPGALGEASPPGAAGEPGTPGANIFLLQSRPETVWANRAAEPAAVPKQKAFDHVFELLRQSRPT
jgi:pyruvate,water dikinase